MLGLTVVSTIGTVALKSTRSGSWNTTTRHSSHFIKLCMLAFVVNVLPRLVLPIQLEPLVLPMIQLEPLVLPMIQLEPLVPPILIQLEPLVHVAEDLTED